MMHIDKDIEVVRDDDNTSVLGRGLNKMQGRTELYAARSTTPPSTSVYKHQHTYMIQLQTEKSSKLTESIRGNGHCTEASR